MPEAGVKGWTAGWRRRKGAMTRAEKGRGRRRQFARERLSSCCCCCSPRAAAKKKKESAFLFLERSFEQNSYLERATLAVGQVLCLQDGRSGAGCVELFLGRSMNFGEQFFLARSPGLPPRDARRSLSTMTDDKKLSRAR